MLDDIAGRLRDQSSIVRRYAISLYKKVLKFYKCLFVDLFKLDRFLSLEEIQAETERQSSSLKESQALFDEIQACKVECDNEQDFDGFVVKEIEVKKKIAQGHKLIRLLNIYEKVLGLHC